MSNQLVPEHQHPQRSDDLFTESLSPNDGNKTPNAVNQAASRDVISVIIKRELKCADDPQKKNRATKTSAWGEVDCTFSRQKKNTKQKNRTWSRRTYAAALIAACHARGLILRRHCVAFIVPWWWFIGANAVCGNKTTKTMAPFWCFGCFVCNTSWILSPSG